MPARISRVGQKGRKCRQARLESDANAGEGRGRDAAARRTVLCASCRNATYVRGHRLDDEIVECSELWSDRKFVKFPVKSCSSYSDRRQPTLKDMEDQAWILRSTGKTSRIGFVKAKDLRREERYALSDKE